MARLLTWVVISGSLLPAPTSLSEKPARDAEGRYAHPLDPLTAAEIRTATSALAKKHGDPRNLYSPMIALDEPTKAELARYESGKPIPRRAAAVLLDAPTLFVYEAVVDLKQKTIVSWKRIPNAKAMVTAAEADEVEQIVRDNAAWQKALSGRGIFRADGVHIAVWPGDGSLSLEDPEPNLYRAIAYERGNKINPFGGPIEGLVALVDLNQRKVLELIDEPKVGIPFGKTDFFDAKVRGKPREALPPLTIEQPKGVGFAVRGHEITWEKWRFRYGLHPREGLVLHTITYEGRSLLHRASLSEMVVPYGDPDPTWNWRAPFDQGDFGMGWATNNLQRGLDVPNNAMIFDAMLVSRLGVPYVSKNAIAVYERDGGILWKHQEDQPLTIIGARARELVVHWVATLGNYDYGFRWMFRQDGSMEMKVDMNGIPLAKGVDSEKCEACQQLSKLPEKLDKAITISPQKDQRYGTLMEKNIIGVNHQHIFNFRLDFDVDGPKNGFIEMNVVPEAEKKNPRQNAFVQEETLFAKEHEARRSIRSETHRTWKVLNLKQTNDLGHHPSYVLIPGANGSALMGKDALVRKRGAFMDHHVWVTQHHRKEMHAAGDYPRQNPKQEGLPKWSADQSVYNEDIVLWYTMVATHVPRPEDWPVMPSASVGFRLIPWGFHDRNPALDVPVHGQ